MTFRVGQKVVCVDADGSAGCLEKGRTYIIGGAEIDALNGAVVRLADGPLNPDRMLPHRGWWASRFRPVVTRKTDISVFTAMLSPAKQKETA